jgi:PAS domain S-box-containing protein
MLKIFCSHHKTLWNMPRKPTLNCVESCARGPTGEPLIRSRASLGVDQRDGRARASNTLIKSSSMKPAAVHKLLRWVVPLLSVGAAYVLTLVLPGFRTNAPMFLFLTAVLASTWYGGWQSGLLATLVGGFVTAEFLLPGLGQNLIGNTGDLWRWSLFILIALMISSLHASRARAEQRLRYSEQRLSLAIDSARLGVWDYNLITRKFWCSKTLETIYGRTNGNFPATYGQFFGLIHFDDQPLFNRAITRTIDEGTDYEIEHRVLLPDKSVRWVNTRGRVFFNQASRAERIVGVVTDITERKLDETGARPPSARERMPGVSAMVV